MPVFFFLHAVFPCSYKNNEENKKADVKWSGKNPRPLSISVDTENRSYVPLSTKFSVFKEMISASVIVSF